MVEMSCFGEFLGIFRLLRFDFTFFAFFLKRYPIWLRKKRGKEEEEEETIVGILLVLIPYLQY